MLLSLSMSLCVGDDGHEIFEQEISRKKLPIINKGIVPAKIKRNLIEKNIKPYYYIPATNLINDLEIDRKNSPIEDQMYINKYICAYLKKFDDLSVLKDYFIDDESKLVLIYKGLIKHKDVVDFLPTTVMYLAKLGLGISYNHVYDD